MVITIVMITIVTNMIMMGIIVFTNMIVMITTGMPMKERVGKHAIRMVGRINMYAIIPFLPRPRTTSYSTGG
jgi:hypothetical protein